MTRTVRRKVGECRWCCSSAWEEEGVDAGGGEGGEGDGEEAMLGESCTSGSTKMCLCFVLSKA
jgi:hypothetical protein